MIYAVVGFGVMFVTWGVISRNSVDQVSDLLLEERLATAQSIAASFAGDLLHIRNDLAEDMKGIGAALASGEAQIAIDEAFTHVATVDEFAYFEIEGLVVVRENRQVIAKAPASLTPAIIGMIAPDGTWPTDPYSTISKDGVVTIVVNIPVHDNVGNLSLSAYALVMAISSSGPLVGFLPPDEPSEAIADGPEYHVEVVDHEGLTILGIGGALHDSVGSLTTHWLGIREFVEAGSQGIVREQRDGEDIAVAVVPIAGSRFFLLAMREGDVAISAPSRLQDLLILMGVIGFAAAFLTVTITTRRIVRSTSELTSAARRMAMGDLDSPVSVWAQDEIGQLADSIETMRVQLARAREQTLLDNQELEQRVAERTDQLRNALGQVISAQEEERKRVSRDLHDVLAQDMVILTRRLDLVRLDLEQGNVDPAELKELSDLSRASLGSIREISRALRPSVLDDLGLIPALSWVANEFKRRTNIEVEQHLPSESFGIADEPMLILFRAAQEAFANIDRHSDATRTSISLSKVDGTIELAISDNGRGFDMPSSVRELARRGHLGIIGMLERVELVGGELKIESNREGTPDQFNTKVTATIPVDPVE